MSEYLSVSKVKDLLAECPICSEHFDDNNRIPRRMPCCVQSICHPCLGACSRGRQTLPCPMCRHQHHLPGGVKSLPKEVIVLRMLEHLKIQKGMTLPCNDCPDNETASARCEDCGVYLCQECKRAHSRHVSSRHHKIISLEEMKQRPVESLRRQHQCKDHNQPQQFYCNSYNKVICVGCTVVDHKEGKGHNIVTIDEAHAQKTDSLNSTVRQVKEKSDRLQNNIKIHNERVEDMNTSRNAAKQLIQTAFDKLIKELQKRRGEVLSELDKEANNHVKKEKEALKTENTSLARIASSLDYMKAVKSKADKIEDLQLMPNMEKTLKDMTEGTVSQQGDLERKGITFVPSHLQYMSSIVKQAGFVRLVEFHGSSSATITLNPELFPEGPDLEFDETIAAAAMTVSDSKVVSNTKPLVCPQDTSCRFREARHILATRPLGIALNKKLLFGMKIQFNLKRIVQRQSIFEAALSNSHADSNLVPVGCPLLVMLHDDQWSSDDSIFLAVKKEYDTMTSIPVVKNRANVVNSMKLCFLFDGKAKKFHLINEDTVQCIHSSPLTDELLDTPLWLRVHIEEPDVLSLQAEICSGKKYHISSEMKSLISGLTLPVESTPLEESDEPLEDVSSAGNMLQEQQMLRFLAGKDF